MRQLVAVTGLLLLMAAAMAWANDYYTHGSFPSANSPATSANMRAELDTISAGFDKLPGLSGNANKLVTVNSGATALTASGTTYVLTAVLFANLGTPSDGAIAYCSDCTIANPCAGSGTGALAKRLNGAWVCN